jgi:ubiquitin carboxyl-terminal hydrolase 4/11/15
LFILGSVPAIIRCWLNTDFKHDTLLYAAVCSGSYTSCLDVHLVEQLGFQDQIVMNDGGVRKIKLSVYLPEAVPVSASSRSSSPAPQLPSVEVDFTLVEEHNAEVNSKAIQIFLGSDMLRAHNADLLFSSSQLTLYDDERSKLQIPLVRPEDERSFKSLHISNRIGASTGAHNTTGPVLVSSQANDMGESICKRSPEPFSSINKPNGTGITTSSDDSGSSGRGSLEQRANVGVPAPSGPDSMDSQEATSGASRSGASPAIWSNWRRDQGEKTNTGSLDWANVGKTSTPNPGYQRRDTGIKVLKPLKPARTTSTTNASPVTGQSRFFDDGKRRGDVEGNSNQVLGPFRRDVSGEKGKENVPSLTKARSANPVGGASAFAWLNSGGSK